MKLALTIVCSLLLVLGQALALSVPTDCAGAAANCCDCDGQMACCKVASSDASQPLPATIPSAAQNQIVSLAPALMVWVSPNFANAAISPTVSSSLAAAAAPIFARNCVRLI